MKNKCSGMEQAAELLKEAKVLYERSIELIQKAYEETLLDTTQITNVGFLGNTAANYKGLAIRNLVLILEASSNEEILEKIKAAEGSLFNVKVMLDSQSAGLKRSQNNGEDKDNVMVYGNRSSPPINPD